jgi:hypothetical protein
MATIEVQQVLLSKVSRTRRKTDIATTKPYALASFLFKVHEVLLVRPRIPHVASNHAARTTLRCSNRCRTEAVLTPGQNILHASFDTSGQPLEMPNATCILRRCDPGNLQLGQNGLHDRAIGGRTTLSLGRTVLRGRCGIRTSSNSDSPITQQRHRTGPP